jgi:branched-chain amino acid transport system substrate-binding protein
MTVRNVVVSVAVVASALIGFPDVLLAADPLPLKVGFLDSYSGALAIYGEEADTAIKAFTARHGDVVAGRKIEIIRRDTTGPAPDVVRRLVQELISRDKVELIGGLDYTPNVMATGGISTQAKMPVLIANAATTSIIEKTPYMSRFGYTTSQVVGPFGRWAVKHGFTRVYSIYADFGPGIEAGAAFKKTFTEAGGTILGEVKPPLMNPDYYAYVQRAKDANPQAVFIFAPGAGHPRAFLKAYRDSGMADAGVKILATGDLPDELQLEGLGAAALGIITTFHYSEAHDSPFNREFVRDFYAVAPPRVRPDFTGVAAYDVMAAIYKIVEAENGKIDPDKTMALIKGMKFESPRGPIMIDQNRDIVQNVYIREVRKLDDKLQNVEFDTIPAVDDHGHQTK